MDYLTDLQASIMKWKAAEPDRSLRVLAHKLGLGRELVRRAAAKDGSIPMSVAQKIVTYCQRESR